MARSRKVSRALAPRSRGGVGNDIVVVNAGGPPRRRSGGGGFARRRGGGGLSRARRALATKSRQQERIDEMVRAAVTGASTYAFSYLQGRYQGAFLGSTGVPAALAAGVGGHLLAFLGVGGKKWSNHLHSVANGALGTYLATKGVAAGAIAAGKSAAEDLTGG